MSKKLIIHYNLYADFETTADPDTPQVYSWCISGKINQDRYNFKTPLIEGTREIINKEWNIRSVYGVSLQSFWDFCMSFKTVTKIWFNNGAGFDNHFIFNIMKQDRNQKFTLEKIHFLKDGSQVTSEYEEYIQLVNEKRIKYMMKNVLPEIKKQCYLKDGTQKKNIDKWKKYLNDKNEFDTLKFIKDKWNMDLPIDYDYMMTDNSKLYSIATWLDDTFSSGRKQKNKEGWVKTDYKKLVFADSNLLFPTSVKKMGETLSKDAQIKGMPKEKADHLFNKQVLNDGYIRKELYRSLDELEKDGNQLEYLIQDTLVVLKFHDLMELSLPRSKWELTVALTSYNNFLEGLSDQYMRLNDVKEIKQSKGGTIYKSSNGKLITPLSMGKKFLSVIAPTSWLLDYYDIVKPCYTGGITMVNEFWRGKMVRDLAVLDVNSMYPSIMASDLIIPIGKPLYGDTEDPKYVYKQIKLTILKPLTNDKGMPFLPLLTGLAYSYQKTLNVGEIYYIDNATFDAFVKYYNATPDTYIKDVMLSYKGIHAKQLFGKFIKYWYSVKSHASLNGEEGAKLCAKFILNALYGKFGTKQYRYTKVYNELTNQWIKVKDNKPTEYYLPIACAITSYSRLKLVNAVDNNFNCVVYCDTDSLFIKDWTLNKHKFAHLVFDPYKIGAWDIECVELYGLVRRPKQYYFEYIKGTDKKVKCAMAGFNLNAKQIFTDEMEDNLTTDTKIIEQFSFHDMIYGKIIPNQLRPKRLPSGVYLEPTIKKIPPIWHYKSTPQQLYTTKQQFISNYEQSRMTI